MSDTLGTTPSSPSDPDESGTSVHDPSEEPVGGAESVPEPESPAPPTAPTEPSEPIEPSDDDLGIER